MFKNNTAFLWWTGLSILLLNKIRYTVKGYQSPNLISETDAQKQLDYDFEVVTRWENWLAEYTQNNQPFFKKNILELGPGSDLGTGIICLDLGANNYYAYDKHSLTAQRSTRVYELLNKKLKNESARLALKDFLNNSQSILKYQADSNFSFDSFEDNYFNLVVSQAAFEHFENIDEVVKKLSLICKSGTVLCAEIDLKTHSRWIRDLDPNNIYRYPKWLFNLCHYDGIPNRLRPEDYKNVLEKNGWKNVQIKTLTWLDDGSVSLNNLNTQFKKNDMKPLSIALLATKN